MYPAEPEFRFLHTDIFRIAMLSVTAFRAKMAIDADGCPLAYHPGNTGLDDLKHAGYTGNWWGVATHDASTGGEPLIQKAGDPAPGYYVSTTSLVDNSLPYADPLRYADARSLPYFVLPDRFSPRIALGDIAWVYNENNGSSAFAVFADAGPDVGEGSMFLAALLGIDNNPRDGGVADGVLFFIFEGSGRGNGVIPSAREINAAGTRLMKTLVREELIKTIPVISGH